eukprot:555416-Karenia_brevis.AAC.1
MPHSTRVQRLIALKEFLKEQQGTLRTSREPLWNWLQCKEDHMLGSHALLRSYMRRQDFAAEVCALQQTAGFAGSASAVQTGPRVHWQRNEMHVRDEIVGMLQWIATPASAANKDE